ncbi:YicC family protein [Phyllobacterium salinisoli]|uniref:YicC family protein n=1 Tax=Phyllobacterium salinisoli TaxID=1899321 RepID=A0A368K598_9HYPH|nr:YicC/YloC family endoribonuclease [Phyllobacterium salinisoli]RCS23170.1 YicC family protein [Phyllobacterium salinisoli]
MILQSMTGFARHAVVYSGGKEGAKGDARIVWELRSVNGKGLDVRFRLPQGLEGVEPPARTMLARHFSRGNFQAGLTVERSAAKSDVAINESYLANVMAVGERLRTQYGLAPASVDGILALRGVLDQPQETESQETQADLEAAILAALDGALAALGDARRAEGSSIGAILAGQIDMIAELAERARNDASRSVEAVRARLAAQMALLLDAASGLDETRLYMEAAFLATKADIQEELDRLDTHVASARQLIGAGGPIGRKLDFLSQEFNREANTLCSKSNAASITAIGLELKAVVDQFREQVQNLE